MRGLPTDQATVELHTTESEVITDKIDPSIFQEGEVTAKVTAANVDSATESCKEVAIDVAAADVILSRRFRRGLHEFWEVRHARHHMEFS